MATGQDGGSGGEGQAAEGFEGIEFEGDGEEPHGGESDFSGRLVEFDAETDIRQFQSIQLFYPRGSSTILTRLEEPLSPPLPSSCSPSGHPRPLHFSSSSFSTATASTSSVLTPTTPLLRPTRPTRPVIPTRLVLRLAMHLEPPVSSNPWPSRLWLGWADEDDESCGYAVKEASPKTAARVRWEATLGLGVLADFGDDVAKVLGLYQGEDGLPVIISVYGGFPEESWKRLSEMQRFQAFLSLLKLHQRANVVHGDVWLGNAVVSHTDGRVRWVDFEHASLNHDCPGKGCEELEKLIYYLGLDEAQRARLSQMAREAVLRWE